MNDVSETEVSENISNPFEARCSPFAVRPSITSHTQHSTAHHITAHHQTPFITHPSIRSFIPHHVFYGGVFYISDSFKPQPQPQPLEHQNQNYAESLLSSSSSSSSLFF